MDIIAPENLDKGDRIRIIDLNFYLFDEASLKKLASYVYKEIFKKNNNESDTFQILILYQKKGFAQDQHSFYNSEDLNILKNRDVSSFWLKCVKKDKRTIIDIQINKSTS